MARLAKKKTQESILKYSGNLTAVARSFSVSRQALYKFLEKNPDLWDTVKEARETMLDNAESALYKKVIDGDMRALTFFLRTQGKTRGYVERQEVTGADGDGVKVIIEYANDQD